tara:strand:- start:7872 stop:8333 length:462 start_codon:yes stop_codon:yes gene_type:complete
MKKTISILSLATIFACGTPSETKVEIFYGNKITSDSLTEYPDLVEQVELSGQVSTKIEGTIIETCAKKGCWMKVKADDDTLIVRFKDYGFFVPKEGAEGKTVIINGEAFYDTLSVDLLRHYAEDAGESKEESLRITEPEFVLSFTADGVIIQE